MTALRRVRSARLFLPGLVGLLTVLAAVARFTRLGHQSYWYDEAHTVWLVHGSFARMLSQLPSTETSPPLYFILAWVWGHLFGYGEAALRSLSALAGVATVPVAYLAARQFLSARVGLIAAALTATSPLLVWYSQEARSYSLLVLLTGVALLAFAHLRQRPARVWMLTWSLAATLAMLTHYYAALVVVPQGVWLFTRHRSLPVVRHGVEAVFVCCISLLALIVRQLAFLGPSTNWINQTPLTQRLSDLSHAFALGPEAPTGGWLLVAFGVLVLIAVGLLVARGDRLERARATVVAQVALAGAAIVAGLIVVGFDQLDSRNLMALWLPLALVLAAGFGTRRSGWIGLAGAVLSCAIGVVCIVAVGVNPGLQRPDWRALAATLGDRGHRAIFAVDTCALLPLSVYMPQIHSMPADGTAVREVDVVVAPPSKYWYVRCPPSGSPPHIPLRLDGLVQAGHERVVDGFAVFTFRSSRAIRLTPGALADTGLDGIAEVG